MFRYSLTWGGREDILGNVAEVLDLGLQTPVPFVLGQEGMFVEEARVKAAHGMVTLQATVHDGGITLFGNPLLRNLGVDPFRVSPHVGTNSTKLAGSRGVVADDILEGLVKLAVVEEDVGVVKPPVEVTLNGLDGLNDTVELLIPGEDDESTVGARLVDFFLGVETTGDENFIVFFADFPVERT